MFFLFDVLTWTRRAFGSVVLRHRVHVDRCHFLLPNQVTTNKHTRLCTRTRLSKSRRVKSVEEHASSPRNYNALKWSKLITCVVLFARVQHYASKALSAVQWKPIPALSYWRACPNKSMPTQGTRQPFKLPEVAHTAKVRSCSSLVGGDQDRILTYHTRSPLEMIAFWGCKRRQKFNTYLAKSREENHKSRNISILFAIAQSCLRGQKDRPQRVEAVRPSRRNWKSWTNVHFERWGQVKHHSTSFFIWRQSSCIVHHLDIPLKSFELFCSTQLRGAGSSISEEKVGNKNHALLLILNGRTCITSWIIMSTKVHVLGCYSWNGLPSVLKHSTDLEDAALVAQKYWKV